MKAESEHHHAEPWYRSRGAVVVAMIAVILGFFIVREHWEHLIRKVDLFTPSALSVDALLRSRWTWRSRQGRRQAMNKIRRRQIAAGLIAIVQPVGASPKLAGAQTQPRPDAQSGRRQDAIRETLRGLSRYGLERFGQGTAAPAPHLRALASCRCRFPTRREERRARPSLEIRRYGTGAAGNTRRRGSHHGLCAQRTAQGRYRLNRK
jgi:hypothetical protein